MAKTTKKVISEEPVVVEPIVEEKPKAKLAKTTKKVISEEPVSEPIIEEKPKAKKTTKKVNSDSTE